MIAIFGVQGASAQVLDDSLRDSAVRGCTGSKSVIIRTRPGAREALRKSLAAQGRRVKGEFPSLDAITAEVRCGDLHALAGFRETASVSDNATVQGAPVDLDAMATAQLQLGRLMEAASAQQLQANLFSTLGVRQSVLGTLTGYVHAARRRRDRRLGHPTGLDFGRASRRFTISRTATFALRRRPTNTAMERTSPASAAGTYVGVARRLRA